MGRKRNDESSNWLPPRVYRGKSAYEFHPKCGGNIRLCNLDASRSLVLKRYQEELEKYTQQSTSFTSLCQEFMTSTEWYDLSLTTRKDYEKYFHKVNKVFGRMLLSRIRPQHIRQYMDKRGRKSKVQANREHAFLSKVFSWGYERGRLNKNPCHGVKKYTEKPRDRYITDQEYELIYKHASLVVKIVMEISYLCAARISDVLHLTYQQIQEEGIFIKQGKTGKKQIKAWSEDLRRAIKLARTLPGLSSFNVIHKVNGTRYSYDGFRYHWNLAKKRARQEISEQGLNINLDFTFHDIKAKGISDFEGSLSDKQEFSGHKTITQTEIYDRKIRVVPTVNRKDKKHDS
ncbi:tyrosine-type recombinase/integrase [Spartinivicinus ruber]|uniref:tyrosine-type recombinase/integrase n=1 Tax=Spartinivicinus ruber TaxID=2683272 RepID=UPI0013D02AAF|nr:tyrosine-type recombinase/integrase [Spartinivicinus ruber]